MGCLNALGRKCGGNCRYTENGVKSCKDCAFPHHRKNYDRVIAPAYPDRPGYKIKFSVDTYNFEDDFSTGIRTLTHRLVIDENGNTVEDQVLNPGTPGNYALDTYYQHP